MKEEVRAYLVLDDGHYPLILVSQSEFKRIKIELNDVIGLPRFICMYNKNKEIPNFSLMPKSDKIYTILIHYGKESWNTNTKDLEV